MDAAVNRVGLVADRLKAPEEHVGYGVRDLEGRRIGSVKELFANASGEPEYVRVRISLFGPKSVLIAVGFVVVDDERRTLTLQ